MSCGVEAGSMLIDIPHCVQCASSGSGQPIRGPGCGQLTNQRTGTVGHEGAPGWIKCKTYKTDKSSVTLMKPHIRLSRNYVTGK